ncbi:VTT domain-containing protein [Terracidiphilus sp.]|jgi:membrane protein DedA with SNARE-associated domain/rhodanese-related sulfurtransferase|uniref:VTT domain-containing protein n=1 Tax=Terracidiphilus sp. TaxID=1964191 RepID=UPI003C2180FF
MELPLHILHVYGYAVLFAWVLTEQIGIPLPAAPVLLAAGALSTQHELNFWLVLLAGLTACAVADSTWFFIGRRYGQGVVRLLCRFSLEPMVCVRKTENSLGGRRQLTIVFGKFVPGVATVMSPLAGRSSMRYIEFLALDSLGSTIWIGTLLVCGRLFGDALKRNPGLLDTAGRFSGALLITGVIGFFLFRLWRRHRTLRRLAASRLDPEELKLHIDSGEPVYIVDLRHPLELAEDPFTLPGARSVAANAVRHWAADVPRDTDVVVFCACPGEITAAKTALELQKFGIERVRPLKGGYDAWKRLGYPVDAVPGIAPAQLVQLAVTPRIDSALS